MSKRTLILIAFLTLLTAFFIYIAVSQRPSRKTTPVTKVTPTQKPIPAYTLLTLSPQTLSLSSNSGSLQVLIDTGTGSKTNMVTAVQLEMQYDPKMISGVTITSGDFIPNATQLVNTVDPVTGTMTYALAISPAENGKAGKGTVATIRFQSIMQKGQKTSLTLLPTTLVTAQGVAESVLKNAMSATIMNTGATTTQAPLPVSN